MLQSNTFQFHNLVPEYERKIKMFCSNFKTTVTDIKGLDVDDEAKWLPLDKIYPGLNASETIKDKTVKPHEMESFLKRCRDWYREAIRQILARNDLNNFIYAAIKDLEPNHVIAATVRVDSAALIAKCCPRIVTNLKLDTQVLDREWRSLRVDNDVKSANGKYTIESFWKKT